ncbi:unnamed protein product [Closterium sp. Yama58-4]|nr:unnamed protein product [Closterium sp. Yama58-4]
MLSAISWVPRGAAKPFSKTAELDEEEVAEVRRRAEGAAAAAAAVAGGVADAEDGEERDAENDEDAAMEEEEEEEGSEEEGEADGEEAAAAAAALAAEIRKAKKGQSADDRLADELAELDMDHYDDEADVAPNLFGTGKGIGAAYYRSNDEDPYLTKAEGAEDEDDEDEIEDLTIRDTDLLILAARNEDDVSFIEVWVCEEQQREEGEDGDDVAQNDKDLNIYVHHDIMLPAFPLALAWMDFNPSAAAAAAGSSAGATAGAIAAAGAGASVLAPGNFVAVATMDPSIEIWDLDVLDEVEPAAALGGFVTTTGGAGGDGEEEDDEEEWEEVEEEEEMEMGGGGSGEYRNVLASGGEDRRVKVWDMAAQRCDRTLKLHTGKVQAVAWAPLHATSLLSGSFDRSLALVSALVCGQSSDLTLKLHTGKVQAVAWAPLHATSLLSGSFDRSLALVSALVCGQSSDLTLKLHTGKVQAVAWAPLHATSLLSGSFDRSLALVSALVCGQSSDLTLKLHTGKVQAVAWAPLHATSLLSGSFDRSLALVSALVCGQSSDLTLKLHTGKVQAMAWAPLHATSLLSGAAVGRLCKLTVYTYTPTSPSRHPLPPSHPPHHATLFPFQTDVRSPDATVLRWGVSADVEALAWDPHDSTRFVVSSEDGLICCHDTRAGSSNTTAASSASPSSSFPNALFTIHAHTKAACTVSWNPKIPNLLASGSTDKTVKLWDLTGNQARCLESSNPKLGAVFSVAFCADAPGFLAMGGSKGKLKVWDSRKVADVGQRLRVM